MYMNESVAVIVDHSQQLHKYKMENKRFNDEHQRDQSEIRKLTETNVEHVKTIRYLKVDNQRLQAQNKQLQSQFNRISYDANQKCEDGSNKPIGTKRKATNVYEVEKLVSHRTRNGSMQFLVRWKGYDADSDTWEREKNLNCPRLLKKYLQSLK